MRKILITFLAFFSAFSYSAPLPTSGVGPESQATRELKTNTTKLGWVDNLGAARKTNAQLYAGANVNADLGPELVSNGAFTTDLTGWSGANWSHSSGTALHTAGSIAALTQGGLTATVGHTYRVVFTTVGSTAGRVQPYFGGVWGALTEANATYTNFLTAGSTDALSFTPTSEFDGAIDNVSVRRMTNAPLTVEGVSEFRAPVTMRSKIVFSDGLPISIGYDALPINTTGEYNVPSANVAIGHRAGTHTTSGQITAVGYYAGYSNSTGVLTAMGKWAGYNNRDGHATFFGNAAGMRNTDSESVAVGDEALAYNTIQQSTAVGYYAANAQTNDPVTHIGFQAGRYSPSGISTLIGDSAGLTNIASGLTAVGFEAALWNTTGKGTFVGHRAGNKNTTGDATAVGYQAGENNTSGLITVMGYEAARKNTSGRAHAFGVNAARENTTGLPTVFGYQAALSNAVGNPTALGYQAGYANTTGDGIFIGLGAGYMNTEGNAPATDVDNILIGNYVSRAVASSTPLTNYIVMGTKAQIEKNNQVMIGNDAITETVLRNSVDVRGEQPQILFHDSGTTNEHFIIRGQYGQGLVGRGNTNGTFNEIVMNFPMTNQLNVGVGFTDASYPPAKFTVRAGTGATNNVFSLQRTNGAWDALNVDTNFWMGLQVAKPTSPLHISNTFVGLPTQVHVVNNTSSDYVGSDVLLESKNSARGNGVFSFNGVTEWYVGSVYNAETFTIGKLTTASHNYGVAQLANSRFTILNSGFTGVNTNDPQDMLHVHGSVRVTNDVYDATVWNGNLQVPTKDAVRDKIESLVAGAGGIATNSGTGFNNTFTNATHVGVTKFDGSDQHYASNSVFAIDAANGAILQHNGSGVMTIGKDSLQVNINLVNLDNNISFSAPSAGVTKMDFDGDVAMVGQSGKTSVLFVQDVSGAQGIVNSGGYAMGVFETNNAYTVRSNICAVIVDTTSGGVLITLPTSSAVDDGQWFRIKNIGANPVTITNGNGLDKIDGALSTTLNAQYDSVDLVRKGTNYWKF